MKTLLDDSGLKVLNAKAWWRLRVKVEGREILVHTRWNGGMGDLRSGKWIRDDNFVSGEMCVCVCVYVKLGESLGQGITKMSC